ncbi:hypothetical protein LCGC14_0862740 [marine sediment metagenome]|uniref:Uncharacterized protein n=1 Tax=marine sediment metagenome TaxID=412755 RepID=A0A0F9PSF3_9ZZZZ|nr:hypothetical protein [Candidatus Aminicenantes bacterium]
MKKLNRFNLNIQKLSDEEIIGEYITIEEETPFPSVLKKLKSELDKRGIKEEDFDRILGNK